MSAAALAALLAEPGRAQPLQTEDWTGILCAARAERLLASLAHRLADTDVPAPVAAILETARRDAETARTAALWEVEMAARALAPLGVPVILLKGSAFAAAGLTAGEGRLIGDLDILVPRERLDDVEAALLTAGWDWVKPDPYDDAYYRRWMHELPPLIHRTRDRMIDVHHTILPLTARPKPNAQALIERSIAIGGGRRALCPEDLIVHAAAHLFADGDLAGGLRNLWDVHQLFAEFETPGFAQALAERARLHGLGAEVARACRLTRAIFATPIAAAPLTRLDRLFQARLLARDGWGRETRPLLRLGFYIRSHLIRMPLPMLLLHLWTKWRKGAR
ncbi:MAG: nucleotidyltransferase family protein [Sphingomonadaceae bacterium]